MKNKNKDNQETSMHGSESGRVSGKSGVGVKQEEASENLKTQPLQLGQVEDVNNERRSRNTENPHAKGEQKHQKDQRAKQKLENQEQGRTRKGTFETAAAIGSRNAAKEKALRRK